MARQPSELEQDRLARFVEAQRKRFRARPQQAAAATRPDRPKGVTDIDAAVWTATARVLLNLDEFITRE